MHADLDLGQHQPGPEPRPTGNPADDHRSAYAVPDRPTAISRTRTASPDPGAQVVNGYLGGSLNKDEADEMNLYAPNRYDMPFGPSDLEWLYRKQDVDGATLNSRLSKLAPVSFLNPADGLTRRRLFSTDTWEPDQLRLRQRQPDPLRRRLGLRGLPPTTTSPTTAGSPRSPARASRR